MADPGTKETDALDPANLVKVEAVVLTGGSAYGLNFTSGVMAWLEERGRGVRVGLDPAGAACRSCPPPVSSTWAAAAIPGRGRTRPRAGPRSRLPTRAGRVRRCRRVAWAPGRGRGGADQGGDRDGERRAQLGDHGGRAGGGQRGGFGGGSGDRGCSGELLQDGRTAYPSAEVHEAARQRLAEAAANAPPPLNTTLAVVATDADLARTQAHKLAAANDGIARAVRPVHLLNDGDTVFALATGARPLTPDHPLALNEILAAGAELVTRAIVRAVRAADPVDGPGGVWPWYPGSCTGAPTGGSWSVVPGVPLPSPTSSRARGRGSSWSAGR